MRNKAQEANLFRSLVVVDAASVEEEPERADGNADPLGVALLELAHLGGHLDPKVDLIRILANDLQLDVLGLVTHRVCYGGVGGREDEDVGVEIKSAIEIRQLELVVPDAREDEERTSL